LIAGAASDGRAYASFDIVRLLFIAAAASLSHHAINSQEDIASSVRTYLGGMQAGTSRVFHFL